MQGRPEKKKGRKIVVSTVQYQWKYQGYLRKIEMLQHIKQISTDVNLSFVIRALDKTFPEIIHHCNELQHFQ